jgi:hypothetical protein
MPLSALLSQALVAFIIEFDNEFERQVPHRTTNYGRTPGLKGAPWLVSMVMWVKFLRFIPSEGLPLAELQQRAGVDKKELKLWLTRLSKWWGYLEVELTTVRFRPAGLKAQAVWQPLEQVIEARWEQRFGKQKIQRLRESLAAFLSQFEPGLPDFLPILGYGLFTSPQPPGDSTTLSALLSKALLAFAHEYERESEFSLAISANVLRLLDDEGTRARDLPRLAGVSKESIAMALGFLAKRACLVKSGNLVVPTPKGRDARAAYVRSLKTIEEQFDKGKTIHLRESLEALAPMNSPEPYPDGWRAKLPKPETLPHYPMILHRGGFPDGS